MKRIFILFLFFLFVSCGENVSIIENGVYYYKESSIIVEILNDGYENLCIGRIGDATGVFNELKRNSLVTEIEQVLQDSINNGKFNDFFVVAAEPYWYSFDQFNKIDAIIGDNGAFYDYNLYYSSVYDSYNFVKGIRINTFEEVKSFTSSIYFFVQKIDFGDYSEPRVTKIFMKDSENVFYQIDKNVTFLSSSHEDTLTVDLIDYINKNETIRSYLYSVYAKELEYF